MKDILLIGGPLNGKSVTINEGNEYRFSELASPLNLLENFIDCPQEAIKMKEHIYREIHSRPCIFKYVES